MLYSRCFSSGPVQGPVRCWQRHVPSGASPPHSINPCSLGFLSAAPLPAMKRGKSSKATAAAEPPPSSSQGSGLPSPSSTQSYRLPLFLVYSGLGAGLTFGLGSRIEGNVAMALVSTLWAGFVLAISLTEAWVKFRAPLLDRHVAVDVGRHVFPALNSVEAALALTLYSLMYRHGIAFGTLRSAATGSAAAAGAAGGRAIPPTAAIPLLLGAMLAAQIFWLTPALSLRAQHLIASSVAEPQRLSLAQQAAFAGIQRACAEAPAPAAALHAVYAFMEFAKVGLLALLVAQLVAV